MKIKMKIVPSFLVSAAMLFATAGQLQAGVMNGDFETGDLTGWTTFLTNNGTIGVPGVVAFDVTGSGASQAGEFRVGEDNYSGVQEGGGIFQNFMHTGGDLSVSLDIATSGEGSLNNDGGIFSLLIDGVTIDSHNFGPIGAFSTERSSLSGSVNNLAVGTYEFRILMTRRFLGTTTTPLQHVDNAIALSSVSGPGSGQVPEPASLAIFGTIGLLACGRRRRS